jgi:UDP-N-acetylmuramate--alanine ligase
MSGLASVLLADGASVSGSDVRDNREIEALRRAGAAIHLGHDRRHVDPRLDGVIVSSAIPPDNVELHAARQQQVPVLFRLHALAALLQRYRSVGIAGTHGKTTTSAMVATILRSTGRDPGFLIGAQCPALGGNACVGGGRWFVAEIDESDGLFVGVRPTVAVITNVGRDHLHTYRGLADIERAFRRYAGQAERAVITVDDENARRLAGALPQALTVGIRHRADLRAVNIRWERFTTTFDLVHCGAVVSPVVLPAPGAHNVRNALCAIGAAYLTGVKLDEACRALASFALPHRRFELLEENGVTVVDDFAHLPEEIEATLEAIRAGWPDRRIVSVFQPHRYTRTRDLGPEFGSAFSGADLAVVTHIYPAGERSLPGVTSRIIVDAIAARTNVDVYSIPDKRRVISFLENRIEPGDFVISFGAGDIWTVTEALSQFLKRGRFGRHA